MPLWFAAVQTILIAHPHTLTQHNLTTNNWYKPKLASLLLAMPLQDVMTHEKKVSSCMTWPRTERQHPNCRSLVSCRPMPLVSALKICIVSLVLDYNPCSSVSVFRCQPSCIIFWNVELCTNIDSENDLCPNEFSWII